MSTTTGAVTRGQSSFSIRFWLFLLAAALILLVWNTYSAGVYNDQERTAVGKVTDVQVQSQQIATFAREAAAGRIDAFEELKATRDSIDLNIGQLQRGSAAEGMPPYENVA